MNIYPRDIRCILMGLIVWWYIFDGWCLLKHNGCLFILSFASIGLFFCFQICWTGESDRSSPGGGFKYKGGPLPAVSNVTTPFVGVITPFTYIYKAIFGSYITLLTTSRGPPTLYVAETQRIQVKFHLPIFLGKDSICKLASTYFLGYSCDTAVITILVGCFMKGMKQTTQLGSRIISRGTSHDETAIWKGFTSKSRSWGLKLTIN